MEHRLLTRLAALIVIVNIALFAALRRVALITDH